MFRKHLLGNENGDKYLLKSFQSYILEIVRCVPTSYMPSLPTAVRSVGLHFVSLKFKSQYISTFPFRTTAETSLPKPNIQSLQHRRDRNQAQ